MKFIYVIPAYQENILIQDCLSKLIRSPFCQAVYVVENGRAGRTLDYAREFLKALPVGHSFPPVELLSYPEAGIGYGYQMGLEKIIESGFLGGDWILLSAADLPFEFTDALSFEKAASIDPEVGKAVFVGSKGHPESLVSRGLKRKLASEVFYLVRRILLGLKAKDTQGTVFLTVDQARKLIPRISSRDFFYSTELLFFAQLCGFEIREIPIKLSPEIRPTTVRIFKHGIEMIRHSLRVFWQFRVLKF